MTIGIIAAMEEEIEELINKVKISQKKTKANLTFISGVLYNNEVVLVTSGIGKVNAAICTQILIDDFNVDKVINVGIAGGLGENILPGDVVIADSLVQHDIDTSFFGDSIGQIPRLDVFDFKCDEQLIKIAQKSCMNLNNNHKFYIGRIVSGDQFIVDLKKIKYLKQKFNALACEMEGASIAHVCYVNKIPFIIIRSISDNAIIGAHMDYEILKPIAIKNSIEILKNILSFM